MRPPWTHQVEDSGRIVGQPYLLIGNDPGTGKSRTVVMAAESLFQRGQIDAVCVVCPAPVRSVWLDPDPVLGEWSQWATLPYVLWDYAARGGPSRHPLPGSLPVVVTNPEFVRRPNHLDPMIEWARRHTVLLVLDESWLYQNPHAAQTKAIYKLRMACSRVVELNGTPGEMKHLMAQYQILHPSILEVKNWYHFRAKFCVTGGYLGKQIVGYQRVEEFQRRTAPFTIMRQARECLDIGPEPIRTQIEARLTPTTWRLYKEMQADMVTWLDQNRTASASTAAVRALRLTQLTNGFIGGVLSDGDLFGQSTTGVSEVGREKLDTLLAFLADRPTPTTKLVVFTRYRKDVERTSRELADVYRTHRVCKIYGSQTSREDREERQLAKMLLAPGGLPEPAMVVANTRSGGAGLNFAQASLCVFLGNDYSLKARTQAEKRLDRPGQQDRVAFVDIVATGPSGQRTIDHVILGALRRQEDMTVWTPAKWREVFATLDVEN